jgi:hypothetical protein
MSKRVEVTISVDDKRITLEGPEDFVRAEVERLVNLVPSVPMHSHEIPAGSGANPQALSAALTERDLVSQKQPDGHLETVAVLAYFLSKALPSCRCAAAEGD